MKALYSVVLHRRYYEAVANNPGIEFFAYMGNNFVVHADEQGACCN